MAKDGTIKINTELDSSKAQSAMSKFSSVAKGALKSVTVAVGTVGTAMAAMGGYAIKVGADFESGMSKVSAISGATGADLEALSDKAKEMGAKTKFSATEAASAFEYMAMAGWKTEDMLNGIEGVMNLAAASGEDLASVSDIVTDAITAFGLSAKDSAHFADVLAKAASSSNTNIGMMGETFKYVAPVAGSLGFSVEDCAVAIGLMANSGIKASQAGTSLRQIFTNLVKPTDQMQTAMDELGVSITDAEGKTKSLDTLMGDLRSSFSGLTDSQKAQYAATIAGQEGMSALLAIVNASETDFNALKDSIYNADGAAEKMAGTMQDNLQGSLTILKSSIEGFGIKVYEKMQEPLREAADMGIDCVNRLSSAFDSGGLNGVVEEAGEIFGDLVDRIADTGTTIGKVITPFRNLANAGKSLGKTVLPAMANGFKSVADNLDVVVPLIVAGATAIKSYSIAKTAASLIQKLSKAYKTSAVALDLYISANGAAAVSTGVATGAVTLNQIAVGLMTKQIGLATAAQAAFNAILKANPIGLAVTAITALAAGLAAYALVTDKATVKTYGLSDADKKVLKACKETTDAMNEQREAREESIASIDREYGGYQSLLTELQSITDANGNVKAGYEERAKVITGQLSEALGIEIEMLDGQIQKYGEVVTAIEDVIAKKKAEAVLSTMQEDMANAYKKTEEAMQAYKDAAAKTAEKNADVSDATSDLETAQELYNKMLESGTDKLGPYWKNVERAKENLEKAEEAQKKSADTMKDAKSEVEELNSELDNYNSLLDAFASGKTKKIEDALNTLVTAYRSYSAEALSTSEETRKELYNQASGYVDNLSLIQDGTIKVSDEIYSQMADAAAKTIENFNQLPGGIARGVKDIGPEAGAAMLNALEMADLDGKLSDEGQKSLASLTAELAKAAPQTAEEVSKIPPAAIAALIEADMKGQLSQEASKAVQGMCSAMSGMSEEARNSVLTLLQPVLNETQMASLQMLINGQNSGSSFATGVSSTTGQSGAAGKANANASNSGAGSVNPTGTGVKFGSQYASGVGSKAGAARSKGKVLGDNAQSGAGSADGYTPGSDFGSGFVQGIGTWLGAAARAAADLAMSAWNALRSALDEHSPSRKTKRSGKNFDLGLGIGINENKDYAVSKAREVAEDTLNALSIDAPSIDLSNIDIPDAMTRIYTAIDDRQTRISDRVVSSVQAKERSNTDNLVEALNKSFEIDYKRLGKEMARRPIYVSATLDNRELIKVTAAPMEQELKKNSNLKTMLNGGRP